MVGTVEHVGHIGLVAGPHGGEVVGAAGLGQIPAVEGVAGTGGVGQRVVAVDVEGLLGGEGRAAELRSAAVRVNDHGRAVREVRVLALAVVIVVVVDGVGVIVIIIVPDSGEGIDTRIVFRHIPAVEGVAVTGRILDRDITRYSDFRLGRAASVGAAVRIDDDLGVARKRDILALVLVFPAVERDGVLGRGVFFPLRSQLDKIALSALEPANKNLAVACGIFNDGVARNGKIRSSCAVPELAAIRVNDDIGILCNLKGSRASKLVSIVDSHFFADILILKDGIYNEVYSKACQRLSCLEDLYAICPAVKFLVFRNRPIRGVLSELISRKICVRNLTFRQILGFLIGDSQAGSGCRILRPHAIERHVLIRAAL